MDPETLKELWRYGAWASETLTLSLLDLSPEQYTRELGGSFSSIQGTLTHVIWADWFWLERWQGRQPQALFASTEFPTALDAAARWRVVRKEQGRFVKGLSAERLAAPFAYKNLKGEPWEYPLWRQVFHALNHSTHHRGQLTHMLRQLGVEPPTTDFLNYQDAIAEPRA